MIIVNKDIVCKILIDKIRERISFLTKGNEEDIVNGKISDEINFLLDLIHADTFK